jgi:hypothetical protein
VVVGEGVVTRARSRPHQRGTSMLFALLALAVLMLGAAALVRTIDGGVLALGNLGFKQDATAATFVASDQAIDTFLKSRLGSTALDTSDIGNGYSAASLDNLDPTGRTTSAANKLALIDWLGDGCAYAIAGQYSTCLHRPSTPILVTAPDGSTTAKVRYFITRLCASDGPQDSATNTCLRPVKGLATGSYYRGSIDAARPESFSNTAAGPYFRVIVRTDGARGTVSFTETLVHF